MNESRFSNQGKKVGAYGLLAAPSPARHLQLVARLTEAAATLDDSAAADLVEEALPLDNEALSIAEDRKPRSEAT